MAQQKKELGGRKLSLPVKIVIVVFAIIMALSMMLPSLAQFFVGSNAQKAKEEAVEQTENTETDTEGTEESGDAAETDGDAAGDTEGDATEGDATEGDATEATDGEAEGATEEKAEGDEKAEDEDTTADDPERAAIPNNDTLKNYYDTYKPQVKRYEDKLQEKPENLAALLNAAQMYMNWGYAADYASTNEEEHAYAYTLVKKAVEYFDRYLALNDAKTVHVDRALCYYYMNETEEAISQLEAYSEVEPTYPLVWANLGMLYELMGETEKANEAYKTATECDPDDEYGAKTYANGRLIELNSTVSGPGDAGEAGADKLQSDDSHESGLTSTLAQDSGVGF